MPEMPRPAVAAGHLPEVSCRDRLTTDERVLILQQCEILHSLDFDEIDRIAYLVEPEAHRAGELVIEDGAPATYVYFVVSGAAEVRRGERVLARLGKGASVGEMALIDDSPRSAGVVMVEAGVLLRLHRDVFRDLVARHPEIYADLYRLLAARVRNSPAE